MKTIFILLGLVACRDNAAENYAKILAGQLGNTAACHSLSKTGYGDISICDIYYAYDFTRVQWFCTSDPYECRQLGNPIQTQAKCHD